MFFVKDFFMIVSVYEWKNDVKIPSIKMCQNPNRNLKFKVEEEKRIYVDRERDLKRDCSIIVSQKGKKGFTSISKEIFLDIFSNIINEESL
jgi:hypothetical protein